MKKELMKLKNKRWFPIVSIAAIFLTLGIGIGAILLSSRVSQVVEVYGVEGTLNIEISQTIDEIMFKGQDVNTQFRITRIDTLFDTEFAVIMTWNLSGQLNYLDVSGSKIFYQEDLVTDIASNVITVIDNGTNCYAELSTFGSWALITSDIFYVDITFTISAASALTGTLDVTLYLTNNT